jgi:hypothetical protein
MFELDYRMSRELHPLWNVLKRLTTGVCKHTFRYTPLFQALLKTKFMVPLGYPSPFRYKWNVLNEHSGML